MMSSRVESNSCWLLVTEVAARAMNLALVAVLYRILGAAEFGLYTFAYLVAEVGMVVTGLGFDTLVTRDLARRPVLAGRYLVHILGTRAALALPVAVVAVAFFTAKPDWPAGLPLFVLVLASAFIHQQVMLLCCLVRARQEMWREALTRLGLSAASLAGGYLFLRLGQGAEGVVAWRCLAGALVFAATLPVIVRLYRLRLPGWRFHRVRPLVRAVLPFMGIFLAVQLYTATPGITLGLLAGDEVMGRFGSSFRLFTMLLMVAGSVATASLPVLSRARHESPDRFRQALAKGWRYLVLVGTPLAVGTALVGGRLVAYIFNEGHGLAERLMPLLALCLLPDFLNHLLTVALVTRGRTGTALMATAAGAVVALAASPPLVAARGAEGAALAFGGARLVVLACQLPGLLPALPRRQVVVGLVRAAAASAAMGLALHLWGRHLPGLAVEIGAGVVVYGLVVILLGEVGPADLQALRRRLTGGTP